MFASHNDINWIMHIRERQSHWPINLSGSSLQNIIAANTLLLAIVKFPILEYYACPPIQPGYIFLWAGSTEHRNRNRNMVLYLQ